MRISDWSSDVCSSDLCALFPCAEAGRQGCGEAACRAGAARHPLSVGQSDARSAPALSRPRRRAELYVADQGCDSGRFLDGVGRAGRRLEEHTSELQSLMRISYAVFCLKKNHLTLFALVTHNVT